MKEQGRAIAQVFRAVFRTGVRSRLTGRSKPKSNAVGGTLGALFDREGSDKGQWYGRLYDVLLEPIRDSVKYVVEIGIGTMVPNAPSSMVDWAGANYRPGASLRAWRDYFPNAEIHGIDPAPDTTVVGEPRIKTHQFDSRDAALATELFARFSHVIPDLIIDDGLHTPDAQIATMQNFLPHVRPGGLYIVEDVEPQHVKTVAGEINRIRPNSIFVPDMRPEPWVAIAIRTPLGGA
jgi:hypothetical protein